jgi:titin
VIGEGPPTAEVTVTPGLTVPGAPTLSGTAGDSVAHLWWTAPADDGGSPITKYAVLRDTSRIATVDATTLTYDDTTAVDGTTYVYKVRAINAIGTGAASNKVTLTPVAATPSPTPSPTAT